jgi:hypothetical protein
MPPRQYTSTPAAGDDGDLQMSTKGLTFELDGVLFECDGRFDAQDFAELAGPLLDASAGWLDPEALAAVSTFYRTILGDDAYRRFSAHRRRHRTPQSVVGKIMQDLMEEMVARPPDRPSPSPGGRSDPAAASSPAVSPSQASPARPPARPGIPPAGPARVPPDLAAEGDLVTAPAPDGPPAEPEELVLTRRTVNLGDATRTRIDPLYPAARR